MKFLWTITMIGCASCTAPQAEAPERTHTEDELEVLAAVQGFFDTMNSKDQDGARQVLDPEGDFVSIRWDEDGAPLIRRAENAEYLAGLPGESETYLERMWEPTVHVHGPIAVVWTQYDFYVDGEFSHCGVDAFQLLRRDGGWVITGGTYTVERADCPESPLGPPSA